MSDRSYITRFREAVAAQISGKIDAADMAVLTSVMPRAQTGNKITPAQPSGKPVCWVLERGWRSAVETRATNRRELDVDIAIYTPATSKTEAGRDTEAVDHFALVDRVVAAIERAALTLPIAGGSTEPATPTHFVSLELGRLVDGPTLEQKDQLCSTLTLTHWVSVPVTN